MTKPREINHMKDQVNIDTPLKYIPVDHPAWEGIMRGAGFDHVVDHVKRLNENLALSREADRLCSERCAFLEGQLRKIQRVINILCGDVMVYEGKK
jgi:hypothetical protein